MAPNREAVLNLPRKLGLDAVVAVSPENFGYVSGSHIITVSLVRPRHGYAILASQGEPELIVCSIEKSLAAAESWIPAITTYTEFNDVPVDVLARRLEARRLASGKVGIDLTYLPQSDFDRLARALPKVTWVDTTDDIARIRAVKAPGEVDHLRAAARATHRAVLDAMADSRPGDSEAAMNARIMKGMLSGGADGILFMCFASGDRTNQPHAHATDRRPAPGEIIRFDVGATWGPWASDFARTYSAGDPTPLQRTTYRKLREVQEETIGAIKPGVTAERIFDICKAAFAARGLSFHMPHVGHSFGLELHESPMLRPGDATEIVPGMVLNIEPITVDEDGSLYHTEDLVLVTERGTELLTLGLAPPEIPVIGERIA